MQSIEDNKQGTLRLTLKYQENGAPVSPACGAFPSPACASTNCEDMPKVMKGLGTAIIPPRRAL